jgi:hypothetical protein
MTFWMMVLFCALTGRPNELRARMAANGDSEDAS